MHVGHSAWLPALLDRIGVGDFEPNGDGRAAAIELWVELPSRRVIRLLRDRALSDPEHAENYQDAEAFVRWMQRETRYYDCTYFRLGWVPPKVAVSSRVQARARSALTGSPRSSRRTRSSASAPERPGSADGDPHDVARPRWGGRRGVLTRGAG